MRKVYTQPTAADKQELKVDKQTEKVLSELESLYPHATCSLDFSTPLQLLIATILSAQCTDERVNQVTKSLFHKYTSAKDYADAKLTDLEKDIKSTGFYKNKSKNIKEACKKIVQEHDGHVPQTMEELTALPGVARKTANVVLGTAFGLSEGIVVDTHVERISKRLGLTTAKYPEKIEVDLISHIPRELWIQFSHKMIQHGRKICQAKKPQCKSCSMESFCPKIDI